MPHIRLGFSTCPNDTFMFDALIHGRIPTDDFSYEVVMADIYHLNRMAISGELDMIKVSYHTYGQIQDTYQLLESGSALGHNCGPLLISKHPITLTEIIAGNLPVGIPGANTTANLLLHFFSPDIHNRKEMIFHEIMPALLEEKIAAGVIIHENRFTYTSQGLRLIQDLGAYWEGQTGLPIPLGAIVAKKSLGAEMILALERQLHNSIAYAFQHPEVSKDFVSSHAQEMDESVMQAHIQLYVNEYSLALGEKGHAAVNRLLELSQLTLPDAL